MTDRPSRTEQILWYKLDAVSDSEEDESSGVHCACKVDILRPGVMNIPDVPINRLVNIDGIPLIPLFTLLILKLEAWNDHRNAYKYYVRMKRHVDATDLEELLPLAPNRALWAKNEEWMLTSRVRGVEGILREYLLEYPTQRKAWSAVGLEI